MSTSCREVELLMGRRPSSLREAERLVLEQHLYECEACRQTSSLARTITELVATAPTGLGAGARERAIAGAFTQVQVQRASVRPSARPLRWGAALAAAAVLALGLRVTWVEHARPEPDRVVSRSVPAAPQAPHALPESAPSDESSRGPSAVQDPPWIAAATTELHTFGHARVRLAAGTRVRFDAASSSLELSDGQVTVDVDARRGLPFAVVTRLFRVQVLGTQFVVTPERVDVQRGHVQVWSLDGQTSLRELQSGQSFAYGRASSGRQAQGQADRRAVENASTLLQQARAALATADVKAARALIDRAQRRAVRAPERAEADTLLAECALLERHPAEAIRSYLRVAERYPRLSAGENALFAAAQLRAREEGRADGRALFESYLTRYPQGRFADEARARLR